MDGEIVQPAGFQDAELLQARGVWLGDSIAEVARAVESDAAQQKAGELVEDALEREGEALIP